MVTFVRRRPPRGRQAHIITQSYELTLDLANFITFVIFFLVEFSCGHTDDGTSENDENEGPRGLALRENCSERCCAVSCC